jgi:tetratricopeptide (TPR) repeat protein
MVADWLTQGMPETVGITFISSSSAAAAARQVDQGSGTSLDAARLVDAGTAITGAYYRQDDLLLINAEIVAAANGEVLHSVDPVSGPISDPMSVVELLRQRVLGLLAGRDPNLAEFTPPTFEAYREFVKGTENFIDEPEAALEHFKRSSELDPGFLPPRVSTVHLLMILGRQGEAHAVLDGLDEQRGELNSYERLYLDVLRLYWEHRYEEALPLFREVVARNPLERSVRGGYAQAAIWTNRPREAVSTIENAAKRQEPAPVFRDTLCIALHMLGQHERELEEARAGSAKFPNMPDFVFAEAHALAALGRVDEVGRLVEENFRGVEVQRIRLAVEASVELRAHGHPKAALDVAQQVVDELPPDPARNGFTRWYLATLMMLAEQPDDALALYADLASEFPDNIIFVGTHGAMAARVGDRRTALDISRRLGELHNDYHLFLGVDHFVQSWIAAGLGERGAAVEHLHAALRAGYQFHLTLHRNPFLAPLWGFEPFEELIRPKG